MVPEMADIYTNFKLKYGQKMILFWSSEENQIILNL